MRVLGHLESALTCSPTQRDARARRTQCSGRTLKALPAKPLSSSQPCEVKCNCRHRPDEETEAPDGPLVRSRG